jgi:excisionase family DNA binding protein
MDSGKEKIHITTGTAEKRNETKLVCEAIGSNKNKFGSGLFFENLKWITTKEASIYLRVSVGQIRNMVWRGQVPHYRLNSRLRFLKSDSIVIHF